MGKKDTENGIYDRLMSKSGPPHTALCLNAVVLH